MSRWLLCIAFILSSALVKAAPSQGSNTVPDAPVTTAAQRQTLPQRSVWLSMTYQYLFTDALKPAQQHGFGVAGSYEFHIKPRFLIGLPLAYRTYPGPEWAHQLGYGVTLRHFFSDHWAKGRRVYPYLGYGLLQQQTFAPGKKGAAISHDTRLGLGLVSGALGFPLFMEVAGHISRLQYFDVEPTWVPYLNVNFGGIVTF